MKEIGTIGLILDTNKEGCLTIGQAAISWCMAHAIMVLVLENEAGALGLSACSTDDFAQNVDFVLVIGGDGTFLRAARTVYGYNKPLLGINQGYLGFLTEIELEHIAETNDYLEKILNEQYTIEKRMMLTGEVWRNRRKITQLTGLNDLVITKGALSRLISLEIYQENGLVDHYLSDGVIFSTPTGSTGYSLSAGGPIVYPSFDLCVLTPICPHTLSARPIIFPPEALLKVKLGTDNFQAMLTVDGQYGLELENGDEILISKAKDYTYLIKMKERHFFHLMREKLKGTNGNKYSKKTERKTHENKTTS